jgi:6-phosphogluconolactonase
MVFASTQSDARCDTARSTMENGIMQRVTVLSDAAAVAVEAAKVIASAARDAVETRGRFVIALSGGRTPELLLRELVDQDVPWERVHVLQVDERVAPLNHADRNLTQLQEALFEHTSLPPGQLYSMPVNDVDLDAAARTYAGTIHQVAGVPSVFDLAHLGLGADGHTASLVPGDAVLGVNDRDVAITSPYLDRRRMTMTFPVLNRARKILWVVTGTEKREMLARLRNGDTTIPAGRVDRDRSLVLADRAAAGE